MNQAGCWRSKVSPACCVNFGDGTNVQRRLGMQQAFLQMGIVKMRNCLGKRKMKKKINRWVTFRT